MFDYDTAFDRNIGWVTAAEQKILRSRRVAIAGLGGVGGAHLLTLTRLGVGAFTLADFDEFDLVNFNRQVGATMASVGRPKLDVMVELAREINPELDIRLLKNGVTVDTIPVFLESADLFIDGFDFFTLDIRRLVFAAAYRAGIPALTAAPLGMGVGFLAFVPGGMSFEQYFRMEGHSEAGQALRFLVGLAPKGLHRPYLVDPARVDLAAKRGPSMGAACQLCAGVTTTVSLKLLLHRGGVMAAPLHQQYDAYRGRLVTTRLRFGNNGPVQRVRLMIAARMLGSFVRTVDPPVQPASPIAAVLNFGRWAPSGDNAQPWRFDIIDDVTAEVDFKAGAHGDIYDFRDHEPTTLSAGMLLETLQISARYLGWMLDWSYFGQARLRLCLVKAPPQPLEPLFPYIPLRSVDRRAYLRRTLRPDEMTALEQAAGPGLLVTWCPDRRLSHRIAGLGAAATGIRLRAKAAFEVHRQVIDWTAKHSPTGIPAGAVGVDRLTLRLMRWTLRHWGRARTINRLFGTGALSLQLDYIPAWRSAGFFTIRQRDLPGTGEARTVALLRAGQKLQRFWLTAARLGLAMQPAYATLIFAQYGADGTEFTTDRGVMRRARRLADRFKSTFDAHPADILFLGRIGEPVRGRDHGRSTRRSLAELTTSEPVTPRDDASDRDRAPHLP